MAGGPECRVGGTGITITLYGARPQYPATLPPQRKGIWVRNSGELELFGARPSPTWTRLARSAAAGDTSIFLSETPSGWLTGHRILLTTIHAKDSRDFNRNEELTITRISNADRHGDGIVQVRLSTALAFDRYAGVECQAEVGLLTRSITTQGGPSSEPSGSDARPVAVTNGVAGSFPNPETFRTGYGGHIMVDGPSAAARVSSVQLYRMGQTNLLGRYPFHFHLVGEAGANSYIEDSVVLRSFYRCVSIHGTNSTRLSRNIAHDAIGHCFYLEDGVEERNVLECNLASHVHFLFPEDRAKSSYHQPYGVTSQSGQYLDDINTHQHLLIPADITASGFYIPNAYNTFVGNAASGGWSGFAFPGFRTPVEDAVP